MTKMAAAREFLFGAAIFLGAFLLFQVQPLAAKRLLPWFGGAASVWTACMLFFQLTLLAGYLYGHLLERLLPAVAAARLHIGLLAAALLIPILPSANWTWFESQPTLQILLLLAVTVGLPYLLLASTSPLLQAAYSRSTGGALPYRFYALSNLASLLGLLTYPTLVEPHFAVRQQAKLWSGLFAVYAALCALALWRGTEAKAPEDSESPAPSRGDLLLWTGYAAVASTLLLASTSFLCENVASVPFLWIAPLSAYLLTFVLCFDRREWYRRRVFLPLAFLSIVGLSLLFFESDLSLKIRVAGPVVVAALFCLCMFLHGEIVRRKPAPRHLTLFYLAIASGGALGGLLVGVAVPRLLRVPGELAIVVSACAILLVVHECRRSTVAGIVWATAATLAVYASASYLHTFYTGSLDTGRNFYGSLRVKDVGDGTRVLIHGAINHGTQFLDPELSRGPTTYYAEGSGIAWAIEHTRHSSQRVGVLGLGTGTIAAFARPGDVYRFYEINPLANEMAHRWFTYLKDSQGSVDVVMGDGRLSLAKLEPQNYDVLVIDAFSGDAIPVHLLTHEAMAVYLRHLRPSGILALHVTNRGLNLVPVAAMAATASMLSARLFSVEADASGGRVASDWVLLSRHTEILGIEGRPVSAPPGFRLWTDDYSNLWEVLK
jgi:hypothetical protein